MIATISDNNKFIIKDLHSLKITEYDIVESNGVNGIYYKIRKYGNIFIGGFKWRKNMIIGRVMYEGIELVFKTQSINEIRLNTPNYKARRYSIK